MIGVLADRRRRGTYDVVPIRDYVDHIQQELQAELDRRLAALTDAAQRVQDALNIRLEGMNEFRAAMSDLAGGKVGREVFDHWARGVEGRLTALETSGQVEARKRELEAQRLANERSLVQQRVIILGVIIAAVTIAVNVIIAVKFHA